jgi:tetratricopeptide (TPR) repeat protein
MKTAERLQVVADLAWAGRHDEAIAAATAALKLKTLDANDAMTLLDLRAESHYAIGDMQGAGDDAQAMKKLAKQKGGAALQARALCRESYVLVRGANPHRGVAIGALALKGAEKSRDAGLIAQASWRLSIAQSNSRTNLPAAIRHARRAAAMFQRQGDAALQGRALQTLSAALWASDGIGASRKPAAEALALARRSGDLFGQGAALNSTALAEVDVAQALRLYVQALNAYRAAGYVLTASGIIGNIGVTYGELGL